MGVDSGRHGASVHAIAEEGQICPAVRTAALTEGAKGCQQCTLLYTWDESVDVIDAGRSTGVGKGVKT